MGAECWLLTPDYSFYVLAVSRRHCPRPRFDQQGQSLLYSLREKAAGAKLGVCGAG